MHIIFLIILLLVAERTFTQNLKDENLQSLIGAERAFAAMAKEQNTRVAFMSFLADSAVTFSPQPRIGKRHWEIQQPNESWLYWEPVYSDIASSGDWGVNTGPWEFRPTKTTEEPVAFGHFVSVWKKQDDGRWKVLIDIGISHAEPGAKGNLTTSNARLKAQLLKKVNEGVEDAERNFIEELKKNKVKAYEKVASQEIRVYRPNQLPMINQQTVNDFLQAPISETDYQILGSNTAPSNDFAFVYGTVTSLENPAVRKGYMRVWKKEDGTNWTLVFDIIP
jgi:ketosteroid isomerase-like protein